MYGAAMRAEVASAAVLSAARRVMLERIEFSLAVPRSSFCFLFSTMPDHTPGNCNSLAARHAPQTVRERKTRAPALFDQTGDPRPPPREFGNQRDGNQRHQERNEPRQDRQGGTFQRQLG